jgi:adenine-specific DNA-methyltransferase
MEKFEHTTSADIVKDNIENLKTLFPEAFTEGKIDFEVLKQMLGGEVEEREERYGLNWFGKRLSRQIALTPSTGTLRPCSGEGVDEDTTQNIMIEGDNLEVLKLLQKRYSGRVKLIYIDPPYNTGRDFIYPDNFRDGVRNYLELTGQIDGGMKVTSNPESSGRFHTDWLNMMLPRLMLARNLLVENGLIFISIDDREQENLKKLGNEIFGEENFVANVPRVAKRTSDKGTYFRPTKDYILIWSKNIQNLPEFGIAKIRDEAEYNLVDQDGRKYKQSGASLYQPSLDSRPNQRYFIEAPDGSLIIPPGEVFPNEKKDGSKVKPESNKDKIWRWSVDTYLKQKNLLIFTKGSSKNPLLDENGNQSKWNVYPKVYFDEDTEATLHPEDVIYEYPNSQGTKELNALSIPFNFSKPTGLIRFLLQLVDGQDYIVLDFFAGSGTTGDAVMAQNAQDNGNRKYILVQLPEPLDIEDKDQKVAADFCDSINKPHTIAELTKERLRRAGRKIKNENPIFSGDTGFRVFKLDTSNIHTWEVDKNNLDRTLEDAMVHLKKDRTEEDILIELLLKLGLDLTVPIESKSIANKKVYSVGLGALIVCLDKSIKVTEVESLALGIIEWDKEIASESKRCLVFRDSAFENDIAKTNLTAILEQHGLCNIRSL